MDFSKVRFILAMFKFNSRTEKQSDFFVAKESSKIVSKVKSKNVATVVMVLSLWGLTAVFASLPVYGFLKLI